MDQETLAIFKQQLAPYQPNPVTFSSPERKSFSIYNFKTFKGAVELLIHGYKHREWLKAERYYNEGVKAHSLGLYKDAEKAYEECLVHQPEHEPARTNLAALLIRQNSFDLAEQQLLEAVKIRPKFYRSYYNLGLLYRFLNDEEGARIQFEKSLSLNKKHFWSYIALAELCLSNLQPDEALEWYQKSLECRQYAYPVYLRMADIFVSEDQFDQAETSLRNALEHHKEPETLYNLGWLLAISGKPLRESIEHFREAEKERSGFKDALFNLAMVQSIHGSFALSVKNMLRYVKDNVGQKYTDQIAFLEKLIQVNNANHGAYLKISQIYLEQQLPQKAIGTLELVLQIDPRCIPALLALANSFHDLGRHKDAIQTYRRLINIAPEEVEGYLGLTKAYGAIENYQAALPVIQKVLSLDPNNAEINYLYATLMAQQKEFDLAYKHYKRVASIDPEFPRIQKRLKMLEDELEDEEEPELWPRRK